MLPCPIALIKPAGDHAHMELLLAFLLLAILGVLAQAAGTDSRDADPRCATPAW
jgi:hypothetical protein